GANQLTISGGNTTRVFDITAGSANVAIDRLTIANGLATGDTLSSPLGFPVTLGGGILNRGGNLTLDRVTMTGNRAVGTRPELASGGAVANVLGGRLEVTRATFSNNVATAPGASDGGAIDTDQGSTAVIDHSTFLNNQAFGSTDTFGASGGAL